MTSRIKTLKAPPLLNPPGERVEGWWKVTSRDEEVMRRQIEEDRVGEMAVFFISRIIEMLYHMRQLGLQIKITQAERELIKKVPDDIRRGVRPDSISIGFDLGNQLLHIKGLGIPHEVKPIDEQTMRNTLANRRKHKIGFEIAKILYLMNSLGIQNDITDDDKRAIKKQLEEDRREHRGYGIACMHHFMRNIGLATEITSRDQEDMKTALEEVRKKKPIDEMEKELQPYELARMLYALNQILPQPETDGKTAQQPLPPIKKFRK